MPIIPDYFVKLPEAGVAISPKSNAQIVIESFLKEIEPTQLEKQLVNIHDMIQKNQFPTMTALNAEGAYQEYARNQLVVEKLQEVLQTATAQDLPKLLLETAKYVIQGLATRNEQLTQHQIQITSSQHLEDKSNAISHLNKTASPSNQGNWANVEDAQFEGISNAHDSKKLSKELFEKHKATALHTLQLIQKLIKPTSTPDRGDKPTLT